MISFLRFLLITVLFFDSQWTIAESFDDPLTGIWSQEAFPPGQNVAIDWMDKTYNADKARSVFILLNGQAGKHISVTGFYGAIDRVTGKYPLLIVGLQRFAGNNGSSEKDHVELRIHFLSLDRLWFETQLEPDRFDDIFGGAWIEFGPKNIYFRAKPIDGLKTIEK